MSKTAPALKNTERAQPVEVKSGRVFKVSLKGIPRMDAQAKARLDEAARKPSGKRRDYPSVIIE